MIRRFLLHLIRVIVASATIAAPLLAHGDDIVVPNANLKVEGIPPIPAALAQAVALYTEFRPRALASWHPVKRELVVATRATNTVQLFAVEIGRASCRERVESTGVAGGV